MTRLSHFATVPSRFRGKRRIIAVLVLASLLLHGCGHGGRKVGSCIPGAPAAEEPWEDPEIGRLSSPGHPDRPISAGALITADGAMGFSLVLDRGVDIGLEPTARVRAEAEGFALRAGTVRVRVWPRAGWMDAAVAAQRFRLGPGEYVLTCTSPDSGMLSVIGGSAVDSRSSRSGATVEAGRSARWSTAGAAKITDGVELARIAEGESATDGQAFTEEPVGKTAMPAGTGVSGATTTRNTAGSTGTLRAGDYRRAF